MDVTTITSLIGSLGFPILCCIVLFKQVDKITEAHNAEIKEIKEALNNNTIALTKLVERIGEGDNE